MAIQKGDFIKLSFTGKLENGTVFDTTDANVAKEFGLYNDQATYGPETIIVGKGYVVAGLDEDLVGKDVGYKGSVTVPPEKGFGMKRIDQYETVPVKKFKEPVRPGMRITANGRQGVVESIAGGRAKINFNAPFAGETLVYEYTIESLIEGKAEKVSSVVKMFAGKELDQKLEDNKVIIDVPMEYAFNQRWTMAKSMIASQMFELDIAEVVFQETYKKPAPAAAAEEKKE
ncbi:FKBP-type peptidyl-prolyl cis-trans isomerase [Methanocella sp. MCL-LM]|uniref:peptidylprolyl isomerase n=1 Tax=Methanocella sp. MCL-LM TaxID=3412035 RepID=UPI003C715E87